MSLQALIFISIIFWGIGGIFYKCSLNTLHPIMCSAIITAVYVLWTPITFILFKFPKTITYHGVLFAVAGGIAMGIGSLAYDYALKIGHAGEVTISSAFYPIVTLIISVLFLNEELTFRKCFGILLAGISFLLIIKK